MTDVRTVELQPMHVVSALGYGETPEEALSEVLKAKAIWIEAAKAEGKPVPPPTYRPVIYQLAEVSA